MADLNKFYDIAVLDEIQMIGVFKFTAQYKNMTNKELKKKKNEVNVK